MFTDRLHWGTYTTISLANCKNLLPQDPNLYPPKVDESFVCTHNPNINTGLCLGDLGMHFNSSKANFVENKI